MRDALEHHRLSRLGGRHDQGALPLSERRDEVDDAGRQILGAAVAPLEHETPAGKERRQVLEEDLVPRRFRSLQVEVVDLEQREVALTLFRRPDLPRDGVAGAQPETPDLARRDVDVVRSRLVGAARRAQEAEAVLEDLQHPVAVYVLSSPGVALEDAEDDVLLARASHALDAQGLGQRQQLRRRLCLECGQVHGRGLGRYSRMEDAAARAGRAPGRGGGGDSDVGYDQRVARKGGGGESPGPWLS